MLNALDFTLIYTVNGVGNILGNYFVKKLCTNNKINLTSKSYLASLVSIISIIYICIASSTNYNLTLFLFFLTGAVNSVYQVTSSISIQSLVKDEYRARISSVYMFTCSGIAPLARLHISLLIFLFKPQLALFIQGLIALTWILIAFIFLHSKRKVNIV